MLKPAIMKVDGGLRLTPDFEQISAEARAQEAAGYDGIWTAETSHDPFLPIAIAAGATESLQLGTAIAVGFARNPMLLANLGWDLQALTKGRFNLGLGTQIRPHITKRFSMEWSRPAARMKEMVSAVRSIWDTWLNDEPLQFRGEFYSHTLMTPFFTPEKSDIAEFGPPNVWLAAVGELMTQTAGEVCDGIICHGFTTERYLREVTIPNIAKGREKAGRSMDGFLISAPLFVVSGHSEEEMASAAAATRQQIAFYGSTPAYSKVLELHGWNGLQPELNALSKKGEWVEMGRLIDDEILNTFAVVAEPERVAPELQRRFGDVVDRISFYAPGQGDISQWRGVMEQMKAG